MAITRQLSVRIVLDDTEGRDFLAALEDPSAFEPGLRRLIERSGALDTTGSISLGRSAEVTA